MSDHHPSDPRAVALRGKLRAAALACAEAGVPLPQRADLARSIGATLRQVHRYIEQLKDEGHFTTERRPGGVHVWGPRP